MLLATNLSVNMVSPKGHVFRGRQNIGNYRQEI